MVRAFVDGWDVIQVLGEGTFAEVKLLVNRDSGEACALKEVDLSALDASLLGSVRKEICIHKLLRHENVVKLHGSRCDEGSNKQYIFLEYCSGGELYDRIEPELGMSEHLAHDYFTQLITGVEYLHDRGVAHRDLKPENLLLTDTNVLKISDFGMATIFRHRGEERLLERRCGTMPYIAPEIILRPQYNAQPADLWSCGVVLVAMLAGELPWDMPVPTEQSFSMWCENKYIELSPWNRIHSLPLSLIRKLLQVTPSRRYTVHQIKSHVWMRKKFRDHDGQLLEPELAVDTSVRRVLEDHNTCLSQPITDIHTNNSRQKHREDSKDDTDKRGSGNSKGFESVKKDDEIDRRITRELCAGALSQPAKLASLYTSSGGESTQTTQPSGSQTSVYHKMVKRMTRFWVETSLEETHNRITAILTKMDYKVTTHLKGYYTIESKERQERPLSFKCMLICLESRVLVDFRLSHGCGLQFKRHFARIKRNCNEFVDKAPILWPALVPIQALPQGIKL